MITRAAFPVLMCAIALALAFMPATAKASRTTGTITPSAVPAWISISVPPVTHRFLPDHSRLPRRVEHVLMLPLDSDPETVAANTVDALLASVGWKPAADEAVEQDEYASAGAGIAGLALIFSTLLIGLRRMGRRRA